MSASETASSRLRLLTYNIRGGARSWGEYLSSGLPSKGGGRRSARQNLENIAELLAQYDLVGLQEVDTGSFRSAYVDQVDYLAGAAKFPYSCAQTTRKLGRWSKHGNAVLTRIQPIEQATYKLPGLPGRGAIFLRFAEKENELVVIVVHLALGRVSRLKQLERIEKLIAHHRHVIVMGDMNCAPKRLVAFKRMGLVPASLRLPTFPSKQPLRSLDQIWVSPTIQINHVAALPYHLSDHLPVAVEITLPFALSLK